MDGAHTKQSALASPSPPERVNDFRNARKAAKYSSLPPLPRTKTRNHLRTSFPSESTNNLTPYSLRNRGPGSSSSSRLPTFINTAGPSGSGTSTARSSPRISRLLSAVLGSSPSSRIGRMKGREAHVDIVDGSFAAVPASQTVTRPPSPTPTADYSIISPPSPMSFVHVIPPVHVSNGIYDVFTSPTSGPLAPQIARFSYHRNRDPLP